jgi:hypothetical protein
MAGPSPSPPSSTPRSKRLERPVEYSDASALPPRYDDDAGTSSDYVVVAMARHILGLQWLETYVRQANTGGTERVLL